MRSALAAGVWLAVLGGCGGSAPADALTFVERWELLGVTGDGAVLDARVTVGNTGVLRGQGRVEVDHWPRAGEPIRYARWSAPAATERSADGRELRLDTDLLRGSGDWMETWHLRARSDDANGVVQIQGRSQPIPLATATVGGGSWSVGAPVGSGVLRGWIEAGERGGKVDGWGIVLRRGGDGRPGAERRGLYVLSDDLVLGVDEQGPVRLVWGRLEGRELDTTDARVTYDDGVVGIDLRPADSLVVRFELSSAGGSTDSTAHWTAPERWAASWLGGRPPRTVYGAQVKVVAGEVGAAPRRGVVVWSDDRPLVAPDPVPEAPGRRGRGR